MDRKAQEENEKVKGSSTAKKKRREPKKSDPRGGSEQKRENTRDERYQEMLEDLALLRGSSDKERKAQKGLGLFLFIG